MIGNIFTSFIVGVAIGWISNVLLLAELESDLIAATRPFLQQTNFSQRNSVKIPSESYEKVRRIRILCMINTNPKNHYKRAIHVTQTWGKHCDKLIFASSITDVYLNAIGLNITDKHKFVFGKEKMMMQYVYENFLNKYDWFYKADDDTFANIENLRFLLSAYSPEQPIFFGYKFFTKFHRWGYFSGGAGLYTLLTKLVSRQLQINSIEINWKCFWSQQDTL